ncbi:Nif3-like dinuclear metal center hexameric protein [Aquimarina agarilytica]|uniref:Nif3-like dinuclear metal center hexameric protein n=1 Tax=Aquimarina agarilytica TaxID=1087449 RepID=UPI0002885562|nr:Nif3-like dinuclear metal center hexameric protein [Aquimarina agarilytica]
MKVKQLIQLFEQEIPVHYAEGFDNVGLLVGDAQQKITNVLVTLDTLESVIDEAIAKQCNLIVSFHPIVFKGLKKITGKDYVERVVIKAIQHNIAIYAMHTALDNHWQGVNRQICDKLGLTNQRILIPKKETIKKLNVYVPKTNFEEVRRSLFNVGAGSIGNYEDCGFYVEGTGSYKGGIDSNPTVGEKGAFIEAPEVQLQVTFAAHLQGQVVNAMLTSHPYEEVAYEITTLENVNQKIGMGMLGELPEALSETAALQLVKERFNAKGIRHSAFLGKPIKKIAVLGGSGAFAIGNAKSAGADLFITADIKYHEFYQAEAKLIVADIGHYESEQYTKNLIVSILTEKISNFAPAYNSGNIILSDTNTNPIKYF